MSGRSYVLATHTFSRFSSTILETISVYRSPLKPQSLYRRPNNTASRSHCAKSSSPNTTVDTTPYKPKYRSDIHGVRGYTIPVSSSSMLAWNLWILAMPGRKIALLLDATTDKAKLDKSWNMGFGAQILVSMGLGGHV